jgi:hypothetical protein
VTTQTDQLLKSWTPVAYRKLLETAATYGAVVTYQQIGEHVQAESGRRTSASQMSWVGRMLDLIAHEAHRRGDPPLTSLCVRADGSVGEAYARAVAATTGGRIDDVDQRAAEDRLECYRRYATDLPADGGRPQRTRRVSTPRTGGTTRPTRAPKVERPPAAICPTCFMQLPASGVCDTCD